MRFRSRLIGAAGFLMLLASSAPTAQTPTFRPRVTVVPVDVRVVDKLGRTVDDLRESDVQVFEDGKRQDVAFFSHEGSSASSAAAGRSVGSRINIRVNAR
jgi:hypothetical protein